MRFLEAFKISHQDMVSKKRVSYGFRPPIVPKAPRSIRRRGPHKDLVKDSELCAFDLLAAVAGKLLQESESSASSNVADGNVLGTCRDDNVKLQFVEHKCMKSQSLDHGSCAESVFVPEISFHERCLLSGSKGLPQTETDSISEQTSTVSSSGDVKKVDCDTKLEISEGKNQKVEYEPEMHLEDNKNHLVCLSIMKDPVEECTNTNDTIIKSEDSVQLPLYSDPIPDAEQPKHWNNVKLGTRDDDDSYFWCSKYSTKIRSHWLQPRFGHSRSRIRKRLSKYRRDCELTSTAAKSFHRYRKRIYTVERCQQAPIKKRKLSGHSSAVVLDHGTSCDSISNFSKNSVGVAACVSATARGLVKAKDRHVKFSINAFKVPELCIEVPENASVGSLKRAVVEAVTKILGGGIQVGVVLQGKKVRDDHKTLLETGICENSNLDTLGFMLEPILTQVSPALPAKKLPSWLASDPDKDLQRSPATPMVIDSGNSALANPSLAPKLDDNAHNDIFKSSSLTDATVSDSMALVTVPPIDAEALAAIPINQKSKHSSEQSQRRTRRPFSVAEVEALVEAVEKLGTGRWRDVKIGAFEHADHRTYVDLKDKWKTLVHTASISPQQRRGEPVPQELLDRVLAAHSYWSQQQSKQQHGKPPVEPLPLKTEGCDDLVKA